MQANVVRNCMQCSTCMYRSVAKESPLWIICPSSSFPSVSCMLRSKTYLKEHPPSSSTTNGIPTVQQAQGCGENSLHTLQGANYAAAQWFTLAQGA